MINDQIVDYIKHQLSLGSNKETIVSNLISSGWNTSDVNEAFSVIEAKQNIVAGGVPIAPIKYAGFWIRYVAFVVDGFVLIIPSFLLGIIYGIILAVLGVQKEYTPTETAGFVISYVLTWIYYVLMTHYKQATLGKKLVGIIVKSENTEQLSLRRIILRETVGKILSTITLLIGFIMTAFTAKKQALHDKLAHTVVVYKDPTKSHNAGLIIALVVAGVLIIIALVGIMASIVLVSLNTAREKAREAVVMADMSKIGIIIEEYGTKNNTYLTASDCSSGVFTQDDIQQIITMDYAKQFTCYSTEKNYAVSAKVEDSGPFCMDKDGFKGKGEAINDGTKAVCKLVLTNENSNLNKK